MIRFLKGVRFALRGMRLLIASERNFQIQLVCGIAVVILGFLLGLSKHDWVIVLILIGLVLSAEAFNSALERLCNLYTEAHNERIAWIKDVAAAAVLILAMVSALVGALVFLPYLESFWK